MQLPNCEQQELQDEWAVNQTRMQGPNGEQWQGLTELFFQNTQEGFRPRRRIGTKKSETEPAYDELSAKT